MSCDQMITSANDHYNHDGIRKTIITIVSVYPWIKLSMGSLFTEAQCMPTKIHINAQ